jgi:hypothetical protein
MPYAVCIASQAAYNKLNDQSCKRVLHAVAHNRQLKPVSLSLHRVSALHHDITTSDGYNAMPAASVLSQPGQGLFWTRLATKKKRGLCLLQSPLLAPNEPHCLLLPSNRVLSPSC